MRVLLDTCVLSELRKDTCPELVRSTISKLDDNHIFISIITIGEIARGIALLDASKRKIELHDWLNTIENHYQSNILSLDTETVHIWGEITAKAQKQGKQVAMGDGLIAATAIRHGLTVMTRNVDDFEPTGVLWVNPWLIGDSTL